MAFSSYRNNFKGSLAGVQVSSLKELDFTKETSKQRLDFLQGKYELISPFYDSYIFTRECTDDDSEETTEYYKVNLNTTDDLSDKINVFKYCESDASYLLNSKDIARDRQQQYSILTEKEFEKLILKEKSLNAIAGLENDKEIMEILKSENKNDYSGLSFKVTKSDLIHPNCGPVLKEYDELREYLKNEIKKCKNKESKFPLYKLTNLLQKVNDDMILCKIQLRGIRSQAKKLGDIGSKADLSLIDYTNPDHIKQLLKTIKFDVLNPDCNLSHISFDIRIAIEQLYKEGKFSEMDMEIIECHNSKMSNTSIAMELGMTEGSIRKRLKKICNTISNHFCCKCKK